MTLEGATANDPDEMGRELAEGPAGVQATLAALDSRRTEIGEAFAAARRVVFVGTGMSLAVALAAAPSWRRGGRNAQVVVREATAAALGDLDGDAWLPGDLVVAISKSGTSPETLSAARHSADAGGTVVAVTAEPSSPLAALARIVLQTPIGPENGAGTKSGLTALAALLAACGALETERRSRKALVDSLNRIVAEWPAAAALGPGLAAAERTWIAGLGGGVGLAQAAAIMWHEKAHRQAMSLSISELRHGPIEAVRPGDAVLVIDVDAPDAARDAYLGRLRTELDALGAFVVWLSAEHRGQPEALLATLLRLQQLARATALASGTYRDGFAVLRNVVQPAEIP